MILRIKGPSARLRPRGGGKALALMALALAGCQAKSPDIIVQGSSPQDAMRFLENYQKSEKKDILRLSHYTKSLRENHAPGFDWEAYWTEIQTRKLYQSLSPKELEEIFSLKDISCREENLSAYGGLLLAAARHDSQKMLFSGELRQLDQSCGPLPHAALKGIVGFLSQKRKDLERAKLAEERRLILKKPSAERSAAGHIYTGELQKVLALEWSRGPASRSWGDILEPLDREFWADARYISLRDGDREHLQAALQMERALKGGLSAGSLNQDVFLIFGEEGKMQALMEGAGYRNYLTPFGRALNWENLWRDMRAAYPEDPKNGNTEALLDLHAAASCGQRAAAAYQALAEAWGRRSYATAAAASCKERLQRQVQDAYKIEDFLKMAKSAAMDVFQETFQKHEEAAKSKLDLLDKALNGEIDVAGALDKDFAWGNLPHSKSIKRAFFVLWAYQSEKARHYKKDWKNLLERHFSQEDWLKLMAVFRETNDRSSLVEVLDMHQYIYGEVLFLEADVRAILESESLSAADLSKKYGYPAAYLERDSKVRELLSESFWASLKESLSENPGALLQAVQIFEGERQRADEAGGGGAASKLKANWRKLFSANAKESDWLALMRDLRAGAAGSPQNKAHVKSVLDMHQYIYGEVLFLEADVRAILESESLSAADLSKKYGYPAAYLGRDSKVRELLSESFWASLKESLSENPGALLQAVQIFEGERQRADEAGGGGAASKLKANWRKLFSANAKESDWLALMRDLRAGAAGSPQNKAHVKSVLDMHQYIYGEVLFLEADVRAILESESLSAADLSKKYGYPAAYLERDSKVRELLSESFWASLKESLSENPQKLMEFVEAYEADREAGALPSELFRQKWSGFALRHFLVTDWLNLMAALRESSDRAGIVKVFDMHHFLYGGEVLFLADDIFAILKSEKASIKDLESYGYRPSDTNDPAALRAFWRAVQAAVREEAPFGKKILVISGGKNIYPAAVLAGGSACSFEGAKNIYRLFSRFGRERDLFEGFRFAGCAEFLDQFTKEEWKRLAGRSAGWSFSGAQSPEDFKDAWWLARILALRSTSAAAAETAAAQISSAAWQSLMGGMLASYSHSYPASGNELFLKTLQSAQLAYGPGAGGAVCRFFSKEARGGEPLLQSHRHQRYRKEGKKAAPADISHSLVRHFDPYWLMEVFQDLSWEPKSGSGRRGREKANCSQILSERQRNMLLFALSFSVFSEIYREEGILNDRAPLPRPDLIPKIWAGAAKILSLSTKISRFEPGDKWSVAFKSLLSLSQDMDDYSFAVNFSHQILRQVLFLSGNDEALALSRLESGAWQSQPETEYHKTYRNWIRELLRDPESLAAEEDSDGGFFNIPLPFELASWREPSAKTSSPSAKTSSPSAGASEPSAKSRTPSSEAADHQPKMDYARVFIEDIQKDGETSYEISVFGGADLLNPSAQSYFAGGGLQYRLSPLMSAGLEASVYKSEPAAASKAVEEGLRDYGLRLGYPLPKYSVYLSSRYNIFKSHLNFAGFFKGRADFPALFGLGLMGMNSKKTYLSAKIQAGPRLRLFKWLGLHFFLSLSIASAGGSEVLLYPWMSLGLNFNL